MEVISLKIILTRYNIPNCTCPQLLNEAKVLSSGNAKKK
jgi:hypothetical protein